MHCWQPVRHLVDDGRGRFTNTSPLSMIESTLAAAAAPGHRLGNVARALAQPAMKTPSVMVAIGSSLGCFR
jgi:hypothetical protein